MADLDIDVSYHTPDGIKHKLLCSSLNKKNDLKDLSDLQNNNIHELFMPWQCQVVQDDDEKSLKLEISNTHSNKTPICVNSLSKGDLDQSDKSNTFFPIDTNKIIKYLKEKNSSLNVISTYKCSLCGYKCKYEAIFNDHLLSHGKQNVHSKVLKSTRSLDKYKCSRCKYKTTNKAMFNKHGQQSGHCTLSCMECTEKFGNTFDLHKHKLTHALGSEFTCPLCDYKGQKIIELKKHLLKHSEKRLFNCTKCEFASSKIFVLEEHVLSHTEQAEDLNKDNTKVTPNGRKIKTNIIQDYDRRKFPTNLISSGILQLFKPCMPK